MEIFTKITRYSFGILSILLLICILGAFVVFHNSLVQLQGKTPWVALFFSVVSIIVVFTLLMHYNKSISNLKQVSQQLDQLKANIKLSKSKEEEKLKQSTTAKEQVIDFEQEAKVLIPVEEFEDNNLFLEKTLSHIAKKHDIVQGVAFTLDTSNQIFSMKASYAYFSENDPPEFTEGETLPGQVAKNKVPLNLSEIPDDYITILSGLGKGSPRNLLLFPIICPDNNCIGVIELASFKEFNENKVRIFEKLGYLLGEHLSITDKRTTD